MNSEESLEAFKAAIRAAGGSESAIEVAIRLQRRGTLPQNGRHFERSIHSAADGSVGLHSK